MTLNDTLRSIRYILSANAQKMSEICALGDYPIKASEMDAFLKKDEEDGFIEIPHSVLGHFLNGLIVYKRGKDESKPLPKVDIPVTNNIILKKLRVAFELKDTDMEQIFKVSNFTISKSELSAFFRSPDHKNYRNCGDQVLRYFLKGLAELKRGKN